MTEVTEDWMEKHRRRIANATTAKERADAERAADIEHHRRRVLWLKADAPTWVDGTPVLPSDRAVLLRQSERYLANPAGEMSGRPLSCNTL